MKKTKLLFLILIVVLISCSKEKTYVVTQENGVEVVTNSGQPNNKNLTVDLELETTIRGFDEIENPDTLSFFDLQSVVFDNSDNVYFFDRYTYKAFKYDSDGKYLLSFGERGNGPGQITASNSILSLTDSCIVISDWGKDHYFDFSGNFITTKQTISYKISTYRLNISKDEHIDISDGIELSEDAYWSTQRIIKTSKLDSIIELSDSALKWGSNEGSIKHLPRHTITNSDDKFFLALRSIDNYHIGVYDFDFNKIQEINMEYTPTKFSNSDKQKLMDSVKDIDFSKSFKKKEFYESLHSDKLALTNLYYDKSEELLIVSKPGDLSTSTVSLDIFKDGIYLNSFEYQLNEDEKYISGETHLFFFNNGKLYFKNTMNNSLEVYKLNYKY